MTSEQKLLPCPFCGGVATMEQTEDNRWSAGCSDALGAECMGYQSLTTFGWRGDAETAWNRRSSAALRASTPSTLMQSAGEAAPQASADQIAMVAALARKLCQFFDSGGESQRSVRARHASAIFQILADGSPMQQDHQQQLDADPVVYLEAAEAYALTRPAHNEPQPSRIDAAAEPTREGIDPAVGRVENLIADLQGEVMCGPFDPTKWKIDVSVSDLQAILALSRPRGEPAREGAESPAKPQGE